MTDFGLYCMMMFRAARRWHWSAMLLYRNSGEGIWLREARENRAECHRYAQLARKHGYGKRLSA
jgi:hypothetical protein